MTQSAPFGANLISRICAVASKQQFVQLAWTPLSRELPPVVFLIQGELPKVSPSTPLIPSLTSMVKLLTDKARKWSEREKASGDKYIFSTCVKRNTTIRDGYHFDGFTASSLETISQNDPRNIWKSKQNRFETSGSDLCQNFEMWLLFRK